MYGLIGDRFLKRFWKGFHRASKPVSPSEMEAMEQGAWEKLNTSDDLEKTKDHENAEEQFKETPPKQGTR